MVELPSGLVNFTRKVDVGAAPKCWRSRKQRQSFSQQMDPLSNSQWRTTWYEDGEEPFEEIWRRFSDAFADAIPYADDVGWEYLPKRSVRDRFANGENHIQVSWNPQTGERIILERI